MIVGPLLVLCVAYYARGALAARSQTPVLDARDAETLKSVFFSGEPWLVECTSAKRPSAAFFDVENDFAGCIAGCHEVLRRQGLLEGLWCLDPEESLGPGQRQRIDRVLRNHPDLSDDAFVSANLERWLDS